MKAIVYTEYGPADVLHLAEVEKPTPKDNEVLIKVHATAATAGDCNVRGFTFVPPGLKLLVRLAFGFSKPNKNILGVALAGEIESVGKNVTSFKPGDQVYGLDSNTFGAYAEYACWTEKAPLTLKPANLTYAEAAALPGGANTILFYLRDSLKLQPGQKILLNGASGALGTYAVQMAKYYGAEVTGVCSTANLELVKSLGADQVIDYTQEDFTQNGKTYDVILDMVGNLTFARCQNSLNPNGTFLSSAPQPHMFLQMLLTSITGGKKVMAPPPPERQEDLVFLRELVEAGKLKPVIDRSYPLEQTAEAHRYVDMGRKKGNVVITVVPGENS